MMGRKETGETQKSSQRLALLPRSAVIVGLTPSWGVLWVCGAFSAWLRGHPLTVQSHPSLTPNWISHRGCLSPHVSSAHGPAQGPSHLTPAVSQGRRGGKRRWTWASITRAVTKIQFWHKCLPHDTEAGKANKKGNQHFPHSNEPTQKKKKPLFQKSVHGLALNRSGGFKAANFILAIGRLVKHLDVLKNREK